GRVAGAAAVSEQSVQRLLGPDPAPASGPPGWPRPRSQTRRLPKGTALDALDGPRPPPRPRRHALAAALRLLPALTARNRRPAPPISAPGIAGPRPGPNPRIDKCTPRLRRPVRVHVPAAQHASPLHPQFLETPGGSEILHVARGPDPPNLLPAPQPVHHGPAGF